MPREPEEWGGEVRLPSWLRRMLRRPAPPADTQDRAHEARTGKGQIPNVNGGGEVDSVLGHGALADLYHERRR